MVGKTLNDIIEAEKEFIRKNDGKEPTKVYLTKEQEYG